MRKIHSVAAFAAFVAAVIPAGARLDLASAQEDADGRLQASLDRLSALRAEIRESKLPLARELSSLQETVRELARESERAQRLADNSQVDLETLRESVRARREEQVYITNLLSEYARAIESRMEPSELPIYSERLSAILDLDTDEIGEDPVGNMERALGLVGLGMERTDALLGGMVVDGPGVGPDGSVVEGKFAHLGPLVLFHGSGRGIGGIAQRGTTEQPTILPVARGAFDGGIASLVESGSGTVPLDPTLGNALALAEIEETFVEHIAKGGMWIFPILAFAAISFVVALFKAFELFTLPKATPTKWKEIFALLAEGKRKEALHEASAVPGAAGKILEEGIRHIDSDTELIEEIQYEIVMETKPKVMRLLPMISVTAAVAPLLGLLGTVTGMINTFKLIQVFGTGDARQLSSGISEALITTEFGLIVAIPSLILYAFLSRKARGYIGDLDKLSIAFVNGVKKLRASERTKSAA